MLEHPGDLGKFIEFELARLRNFSAQPTITYRIAQPVSAVKVIGSSLTSN